MTEPQPKGMSKGSLMISEFDNCVGISSYSFYNHVYKSLIIKGGISNWKMKWQIRKHDIKPEVFDETECYLCFALNPA